MLEDRQLYFRDILIDADVSQLKELLQKTGVFRDEEVTVAEELMLEGCQRVPTSYYKFIIAESKSKIEGYICYAQIAGTKGSFEVYWLAVRKTSQGRGIGKELIKKFEEKVRRAEGKRIFIGTSSRTEYNKAHQFYERSGFKKAAILEDFFDSGDHQVIFTRQLG